MKRAVLGSLWIIVFGGIAPIFGQDEKDMMDMSLNELLGMTVEVEVASKNAEKIWDAPGIVSAISASEIEQFGANNLIDLLNRITSVYMLSSYFSPNNFASFRGDSQSNYDNHVLLLLNGRPMRESQTSSFNSVIYQAFPVSALKRIEIIRGPGSSLYGASAYSGVINLVTGREDHGREVNLQLGSFEAKSGHFNHSGTWKGLKSFVSVGGFNEDGWDFDAIDENGVPQSFKMSENNISFLADLSYKDWSLTAMGLQSEYEYWGGSPTDLGILRDQRRYFANLGWQKEIGKVNTEANLTYNHMEIMDGAENLSDDLLFEITTFYKPSEKMNLIFGGLVNHTTGIWDPFIGDYDKTGYSAYAQGEYKPKGSLKFIAGGQWNKPDGGEDDFVPRFGVIAYFNPKTGVKLLYGEAYRSPAAIETDFNAPPFLEGNPNLSPETVSTNELQFFHDSGHYQVAMTYFHIDQENLIGRQFTPEGESLFAYRNLGTGEFHGFEFEGKYSPNEALYTTLSMTHQENENGDGVEGFTTLPQFMAKFGLVYNMGQAKLGLFDSYFDDAEGVATTNPNASEFNPPADAFHLVSLNLEVSFKHMEKLKLYVFGQNLLDEDIYLPELVRRRMNTLPSFAGASVYAGVNWSF